MEEEEEERRSEEEEDHWNEPPWNEAPWIDEELIRGGLDEWAVHDAEYRWHVGAQGKLFGATFQVRLENFCIHSQSGAAGTKNE